MERWWKGENVFSPDFPKPELLAPLSSTIRNAMAGKHLAYNFAAANLLRKYGPDWRDLHLGLTGKRLASWGFNTVGTGRIMPEKLRIFLTY